MYENNEIYMLESTLAEFTVFLSHPSTGNNVPQGEKLPDIIACLHGSFEVSSGSVKFKGMPAFKRKAVTLPAAVCKCSQPLPECFEVTP